jgi:hypothetical protein
MAMLEHKLGHHYFMAMLEHKLGHHYFLRNHLQVQLNILGQPAASGGKTFVLDVTLYVHCLSC